MNMRSKSLATLTAVTIAATGFGITPGAAAPAKSRPGIATSAPTEPITDFSSRRRGYRNNDAAAIATFLAIAGTAAAVAASRRDRHRHYYGYGPRPYYGGYGYGPPPGYYYAPRYGYGW